MVGGAGWAGWSLAHDQTRDRAGGNQSPNGPSTSGDPQSSRAPAPGDLCGALWSRQLQVQLAADSSLEQWRLHIDAMNQLVAGKITLAQASAYWAATRKGAMHRVERFRRMYAGLQRSDLACPVSAASAACADATRSADTALADAYTAITTWSRHIRDMERLRTGRMTPTQATNMWVSMWRAGNREVDVYDRDAAKTLQNGCP
jgi:hypothetical protein